MSIYVKDLKAYIINTENIMHLLAELNEMVTFANGEQLEMGREVLIN